MKTSQVLLKSPAGAVAGIASLAVNDPTLVLVFGALPYFESPTIFEALRDRFPRAAIAGCSTAGEIADHAVHDGTCVVTAVSFERASAVARGTPLRSMADSFDAGVRLAQAMPKEGLSAVFVLGTGVQINGSALVRGLLSILPDAVKISGGLAGDGGAFKCTWTLGPAGCADDQIVAIGLYGESVKFGYGSFGGWSPFGPARKVTRCADNVLYELDGERALDIYKRYLGEHAERLPSSGLLFPFEMLSEQQAKSGIFRTILGIDEAQGSLTLAGEIDPNGFLRLMHSNTEKLIDGAEVAARTAQDSLGAKSGQSLAMLVSCVGRKLVMGDRVDEEVEAVADLFGSATTVTGFYSYGEIAGADFFGQCRLHNQTMTITLLTEE